MRNFVSLSGFNTISPSKNIFNFQAAARYLFSKVHEASQGNDISDCSGYSLDVFSEFSNLIAGIDGVQSISIKVSCRQDVPPADPSAASKDV
jgi:hypothetical protein